MARSFSAQDARRCGGVSVGAETTNIITRPKNETLNSEPVEHAAGSGKEAVGGPTLHGTDGPVLVRGGGDPRGSNYPARPLRSPPMSPSRTETLVVEDTAAEYDRPGDGVVENRPLDVAVVRRTTPAPPGEGGVSVVANEHTREPSLSLSTGVLRGPPSSGQARPNVPSNLETHTGVVLVSMLPNEEMRRRVLRVEERRRKCMLPRRGRPSRKVAWLVHRRQNGRASGSRTNAPSAHVALTSWKLPTVWTS